MSAATVPQAPPALPEFAHVHRFWDGARRCHVAKILPGQYYVTLHGEAICTVLGSCVSACIRDRLFGIGGMNHFMLPESSETGRGMPDEAARYGSYAMELLINALLKHGARREHLEVKLVGGGRVLEGGATRVGERNIAFVRRYLAMEGLPVAGEDLGGVRPRKVYYFPDTGRLLVKKLRAAGEELVRRERRYLDELRREPVGGEVELF